MTNESLGLAPMTLAPRTLAPRILAPMTTLAPMTMRSKPKLTRGVVVRRDGALDALWVLHRPVRVRHGHADGIRRSANQPLQPAATVSILFDFRSWRAVSRYFR